MSIIGRITGLEKDIFSLDIGYKDIKIVQLKKSGSLFKLVGFGTSPSVKEPFSKENIKDKKALSAAIKKAVSEHHISALSAVSALPESLVFTKIIKMPKMKLEELVNSVPLEAANFIPLEPAQTYLDFQIVGEVEQNYEILVVAAPKTLVDDLIETVKLAGLSVICIETKPLANVRALINKKEKEGILILDIGGLSTSLTIYDNNAIKLTATFPIGGELWIKNPDKDALTPLIDNVAESLKYYQSHQTNSKVAKIMLGGGGGLTPGLPSLLKDKIGIKTELGNPWQAVKNPPKEQQSLQYTTAIGLAMREV